MIKGCAVRDPSRTFSVKDPGWASLSLLVHNPFHVQRCIKAKLVQYLTI